MNTVLFKGAKFGLRGTLPLLGKEAPQVRLTDEQLNEHTFATWSGKTKVLTFNPSIDTSVCQKTVRTFNQRIATLEGTVVLAISADLPFALKRFCGAEGIGNVFALSTIRDPDLGARYGLHIDGGPLEGLLARAVMVLDAENVVRYTELVDEISGEPDYERALSAAQGR